MKKQKRILQIRDDFQEELREEPRPGYGDTSQIPDENLLGILYLNSRKEYSMYQRERKKNFSR